MGTQYRHITPEARLKIHQLLIQGWGIQEIAEQLGDRQDLLGHRSGRITTHYSSAELQNLYEAANKVCEERRSGVVLRLLRNRNLESGGVEADSKHKVIL